MFLSTNENDKEVKVKKSLKLVFSLFALFSLISCTDQKTSSSNLNPSTSSTEPQQVYYHVIFNNYDDSLLYEVDVLEGQDAVYAGETPTKAEDDEFTYEFVGWDQNLHQISGDVTAKAQYNPVPKEPGWGPIIK